MADGMIATGLGLFFKEAGGSTWAEIARVVDVDAPSASVNSVDVSHQKSSWREKIPGLLKEAGQVSAAINTVDEDLEELYGLVGVSGDFEIVMPDGNEAVKFSGFILEVDPGSWALDDKMEHALNIEVSGAVTYGSSASGS